MRGVEVGDGDGAEESRSRLFMAKMEATAEQIGVIARGGSGEFQPQMLQLRFMLVKMLEHGLAYHTAGDQIRVPGRERLHWNQYMIGPTLCPAVETATRVPSGGGEYWYWAQRSDGQWETCSYCDGHWQNWYAHNVEDPPKAWKPTWHDYSKIHGYGELVEYYRQKHGQAFLDLCPDDLRLIPSCSTS